MSVAWLLKDSGTEAMRHLRVVPRNTETLLFSTIQPIMFVLLFVYVFGGSIEVPGFENYRQYLLPGIFTQTVVFGSSFTAVGLAEDMQKGFIDRLRSLPMAHSAVLIGRTLSDLARNLFTFVVMFAVAYLVGFRIRGGILDAIAATLLLLGFAYAFSWLQASIGLSVGSVEAANAAGFIWMFPMTFVSSAFVDTRNMPSFLQTVADINPFTKATNAVRALYNGHDPGTDLIWALAWAIGLTVVFSLLSTRKFENRDS
jgi:ABC transporter DrrB family efflux protein